MKQVNKGIMKELTKLFGDRISFDETEIEVYSHDIGVMPSLVKKFLGEFKALAVVQPVNEEEIVHLVKLANEKEIPLIPRGKATSGYGGIYPLRKGVIIDFSKMNRVIKVNRGESTVEVEAGVIWSKLEEKLEAEGLSLRLYPTSAPSSTVAGWLAQGGAGLGSFEYGWFKENVVSARVVTPEAEIKEFKGEELELISDAEGITGLITRVKLKVKGESEDIAVIASFKKPEELKNTLLQIYREEIPVWSINFVNPDGNKLKNLSPPKVLMGKTFEKPILPEEYTCLFVFPVERTGKVLPRLKEIVKENKGKMLPEEISEHEWSERFKVLKAKRLGPSIIPVEAVVPIEKIDLFLSDIEEEIKQSIYLEGIITKSKEVVLVGYIPQDERKLSYSINYSLFLKALKIAQRHGGRPYSTGVFFPHYKEKILGEEKARKLDKYKEEKDPKEIFNPGKVIHENKFSKLVKIAEKIEFIPSSLSKYSKIEMKEKIEEKEGYRGETEWFSFTCAQCGPCVIDCPHYFASGWESYSPRGKWFILKQFFAGRSKLNQEIVDRLICTLCGRCEHECVLDLPIVRNWLHTRNILRQEQAMPKSMSDFSSTLKEKFNILGQENEVREQWIQFRAKYNRKRIKKLGEEAKKLRYYELSRSELIKDKAETVYFIGCQASLFKKLSGTPDSMVRILKLANEDVTILGKDERCCGYPLLLAGDLKRFREFAEHNIEEIKKRKAEKVVFTCAGCYKTFKQEIPEFLGLEPGFEVYHSTELLNEYFREGILKPVSSPKFKSVTYHDPCDIGRHIGLYKQPRNILSKLGLKFIEMKENKEKAFCCGGGGLQRVINDDLTMKIARRRANDIMETGVETVVSACPSCEKTLSEGLKEIGKKIQVTDIVEVVAENLQLLPG